MKQYSDVYNTPLKFYKFNMYFRLPFTIILSLFSARLLFSADIVQLMGTYATVRLAITMIASVIFAVGALVGMKKFRPRCWFFQMALEISAIVLAAADVCYDLYLGVFQFSATMGAFSGAAAVSFAIMLYFYKRKPLFFAQQPTVSQGGYCTVCGGRILPQDSYCNMCGTKVTAELHTIEAQPVASQVNAAESDADKKQLNIVEKAKKIISGATFKKYAAVSCVSLFMVSVVYNVYQRIVINEAMEVIALYEVYYDVNEESAVTDAEYIKHLEEQNEEFWQHKLNYDTVCRYLASINGKKKDSTFYPETDFVIVNSAAGSQILAITCTYSTSELYCRSNNGYVKLDWGSVEGDSIMLEITGVEKGADIVAIEDKANNKNFNVLVIVV